jgi:hypothetical protein
MLSVQNDKNKLKREIIFVMSTMSLGSYAWVIEDLI